ncbi:serine/threonine protein kinase [Leyella stercorea]|uniref:serine/threonine protein kinase n=1 Tax=Leyella stercorea TaxID=363265 RepID=UPI00242B0367|nr:serine/threonine-protein kinase [Leyella stercorea]
MIIGTLLHGGTYKIEKILGQGSFGITYLAEHTNLGKKVAIKEFFMKELNSRGEDGSITGMSDSSLSQNYCQKFKKEAINLSRLDHPNIVRVTDSFSENGTFYYVMDFIEGQNLNDYIKSHYIDEAEAVSIIKSVADALIYMHEEKHMLHLDLKPGNVMRRNSDGHVFLIDFGLSKHYSTDGQPETSTTIGLGTAGYAPIEQGNQAKNGEFRPTIDVYALGATFYKLLTRETPPPASDLVSDDELLENKLREKRVSDNLIEIVTEAMCPNVRKRTQTIREFKNAFDGIKAEANPTTNNVSSNETVVGTGEDETIVTSANNSLDTEETALANSAIQDEKSRLVKEYMEAFNVEEKDALLYVNTHGIKVTLRVTAAKKAGNTANTQKAANRKVSSPKTEKSKSDENGCVVAAICIIIFFAILFGMTRGCGNNANADSDTIYSKMEYVDLGLSVKWATTNLGTKYLMNLGTPMTWSQAMHYNKDNERLPTKKEFDELVKNASLNGLVLLEEMAMNAPVQMVILLCFLQHKLMILILKKAVLDSIGLRRRKHNMKTIRMS